MKTYWTETRPNGKPIEPGTVCHVTDLEDGTSPIYTYGNSTAEVLDKLAHQNANAQLAMAQRKPAAAAPVVPPAPRRIEPDQVMRATADLSNPAKAGEAVATLFQAATGMDPQQMILQNFGNTATAWQNEHPEFFPHEGNKRLLAGEAQAMAGGNLGHVTKEHLSAAFSSLQQRGLLFENPQDTHQQPPTFPDESQVQRPADGKPTRFATGARSHTFARQAIAPTTRTPKYTAEQIATMKPSEARRMVEANDPDYAFACEYHFGSAQATA